MQRANGKMMVQLDEARQTEARQYRRESYRWLGVDLAVGALLLLFFLVSGASESVATWAAALSNDNPWLTVALYGAVVFVGYTLVTLPLSFLSGFRLPHRYGMSNQSLAAWGKDQVKSVLLTALVGGVVIEVVYTLLRWSPNWWWLWASLFMLLFSVVAGQLAPILVLPLFYKLTPLQDDALRARLQRLGQRAGTRIQDVYTIDLSSKSPAANAAVMGLGKTRRIVLGDTLYQDFTHDEIESIFAHELGHHVHGDLPKMIALQGALTLGGFWLADRFLQWGVDHFGFAGPADIGAFPLFVLAISLFSLLTMPLANGFSRWRERLADQYALETTGDGASMVRVMTRLANQNLADVDPPRWVILLLHSHPPLRERIERAVHYNG